MNKKQVRYIVAKKRAEKIHRQKIENFYNAYKEGAQITLDYGCKPKMRTHAILAKYDLDGKYYFIVQDAHEKVYLARVICNCLASLKKISKKSKEYLANKDIFDTWISHAKEIRKKQILDFFEKYQTKYMLIAVRQTADEKGAALYKYISKHTYKDKYYFVMKLQEGYFVAKVAWFGYAMLVELTQKELEKDKAVFNSWLQNSKKKK